MMVESLVGNLVEH
jgi:hypothetical protein